MVVIGSGGEVEMVARDMQARLVYERRGIDRPSPYPRLEVASSVPCMTEAPKYDRALAPANKSGANVPLALIDRSRKFSRNSWSWK
jgi:hypothetical protein